MSILGHRVSGRWGIELAAAMVCVAGLMPVWTMPVWTTARTRDIVLVASGMAFRLESDPAIPNPVLTVSAGETVRVVLKNRDRGMTHDFAVPSLGAALEAISSDEEEAITFDAPATPGVYEYLCRPHKLMMKGTLRVTR